MTALLRPNADTSHEQPEHWYLSYGAHVSTARAGDVEVQAVDWDWLDDDDNRAVAEKLRASNDDLTTEEAMEIVELARLTREAAETVCGALDQAVEAYEAGDLYGCIEALNAASGEESDHGDDPATQELRNRLLTDGEVPQ